MGDAEEGNGSFKDKGDLLFLDSDEDGYADITFEKGVENFGLTFYYAPFNSDSDIKIELETRVGKEWMFDSEDIIKSTTR